MSASSDDDPRPQPPPGAASVPDAVPDAAALVVRDPAEQLRRLRRQWLAAAGGPREGLWVFGYASLIWRPEFGGIL